LSQSLQVVLKPRKMPIQARSTASVDAILVATIQVLLSVGKERLTTTRVAARAGVSVGTLYQYFPNKSSLLQATLKRHLEAVGSAVERTCVAQRGKTAVEMVTAVVNAFLDEKMKDVKTSAALYAVSSDVDGAKISRHVSVRWMKVMTAMLETSSTPVMGDLRLVVAMIQGVITGVSRRLLESDTPMKDFEGVREELVFFVSAYMDACTKR
jgi:AcrR family transcriptional regulator